MKDFLFVMMCMIIGVLAVDLIGFGMWVMSGQQPVDGMYIGAITTNIVQAWAN